MIGFEWPADAAIDVKINDEYVELEEEIKAAEEDGTFIINLAEVAVHEVGFEVGDEVEVKTTVDEKELSRLHQIREIEITEVNYDDNIVRGKADDDEPVTVIISEVVNDRLDIVDYKEDIELGKDGNFEVEFHEITEEHVIDALVPDEKGGESAYRVN